MPLKKIADIPANCNHPEHNPPMHIFLENGVYEYTCPSCGKKTTFTVNRPSFDVSAHYDDENPFSIQGTEDGI